MNPHISVVMPSYNHSKYIEQAIKSVIYQSYENIELIIVDDCSSDGSRKIINEFENSNDNIRSIFHSVNQGIAKTVNDGRHAAKGDYIAHIASDDVWELEKLDQQIQILTERPTAVVWTDGTIIDADGNNSEETFVEMHSASNRKKSGDIFSELLNRNMIFGSSTIYNSDVVGTIDFDESLKYLNDFKYWVELSYKYNFYFMPECLTKYRIHGSNSISSDDFSFKTKIEKPKIYLDILQNYKLSRKEKYRIISNLFKAVHVLCRSRTSRILSSFMSN